MTNPTTNTPFPECQLTQSYRFDADMADLLTAFQYARDGISLDSDQPRDLDPDAYHAPTPGLQAVFDPTTSLVFITYDDRTHRMANPIERDITTALTATLHHYTPHTPTQRHSTSPPPEPSLEAFDRPRVPSTAPRYSVGAVTPHNAQRGGLTARLPHRVTTNTVEKYQGDDRDVILVSATVSDPEFARKEDDFILDARRLLVAISRSRYLTIVIASTALFEVTPTDPDALDNGPIWARLFTLVTDSTHGTSDWTGTLGEFTPHPVTDPDTSLAVYRY